MRDPTRQVIGALGNLAMRPRDDFIASGRRRGADPDAAVFDLAAVAFQADGVARGKLLDQLPDFSQLRDQRMIFVESAHGHDGKAEHFALVAHALHDRILVRLTHVAGFLGKAHFNEVAFFIEPDFYGLGHSWIPRLS